MMFGNVNSGAPYDRWGVGMRIAWHAVRGGHYETINACADNEPPATGADLHDGGLRIFQLTDVAHSQLSPRVARALFQIRLANLARLAAPSPPETNLAPNAIFDKAEAATGQLRTFIAGVIETTAYPAPLAGVSVARRSARPSSAAMSPMRNRKRRQIDRSGEGRRS